MIKYASEYASQTLGRHEYISYRSINNIYENKIVIYMYDKLDHCCRHILFTVNVYVYQVLSEILLVSLSSCDYCIVCT